MPTPPAVWMSIYAYPILPCGCGLRPFKADAKRSTQDEFHQAINFWLFRLATSHDSQTTLCHFPPLYRFLFVFSSRRDCLLKSHDRSARHSGVSLSIPPSAKNVKPQKLGLQLSVTRQKFAIPIRITYYLSLEVIETKTVNGCKLRSECDTKYS